MAVLSVADNGTAAANIIFILAYGDAIGGAGGGIERLFVVPESRGARRLQCKCKKDSPGS